MIYRYTYFGFGISRRRSPAAQRRRPRRGVRSRTRWQYPHLFVVGGGNPIGRSWYGWGLGGVNPTLAIPTAAILTSRCRQEAMYGGLLKVTHVYFYSAKISRSARPMCFFKTIYPSYTVPLGGIGHVSQERVEAINGHFNVRGVGVVGGQSGKADR
jgi:hypothetical protein